MPETRKLKDYFDQAALQSLAGRLAKAWPLFNRARFMDLASDGLDEQELMSRVRQISRALHSCLPGDYRRALGVLLADMGPDISDKGGMFSEGYIWMPVADYVSAYGLDDWEASMAALYEITKRHTAEYAIRPFLECYPERTLALMATWVSDPSPHVRRLVSEGTRPRLPWAARLRMFCEDPRPTIPLLEALKDDRSKYVRRSVANHINDIVKDHPDLAIDLLERWSEQASERTTWVIRHAARNLVKQGDDRALLLVGYDPNVELVVDSLAVEPPCMRVGQSMGIRLLLSNATDQSLRFVCFYRLFRDGTDRERVRGVFSLGSGAVPALGQRHMTKTHRFRNGTTRRYEPGRYSLELSVNGKHKAREEFTLTVP